MFGRKGKATADQPFEGTDWGPVVWRGMPTPSEPQQIGVYGDERLNQYPARWEGAQLFGGVQGLRSAWVVDSRSMLPIWQQNQNPANIPGGQRVGQGYTGGDGPLAVLQRRIALISAQAAMAGGTPATAPAIIKAANSLPTG